MRLVLKLTALAVLLAAIAWVALTLFIPVKPAKETFVLLPAGFSGRQIAYRLQSNGVIRSANGFLLLHLLRRGRTLKAGEYRFEGPASTIQVFDKLARGEIHTRTVVVPEGFNIYDVAQAIERAGLGPAQAFLTVARNDLAMVRGFDPQATSLEGYLFPDTYEFTRTQSMHDIALIMVRRFEREARQLGLLKPPNEPKSAGGPAIEAANPQRNASLSPDAAAQAPSRVHAIVTMASIVEKETSVPEERQRVASVYYNRLERRMPLAADPTVVYAALLNQRYRGTIYASDLQFDSDYNTYKRAGLPPGPIANPGTASLKAAMNPERTDFLFFVADGKGGHRFSSSYQEHTRNVADYRRQQGR